MYVARDVCGVKLTRVALASLVDIVQRYSRRCGCISLTYLRYLAVWQSLRPFLAVFSAETAVPFDVLFVRPFFVTSSTYCTSTYSSDPRILTLSCSPLFVLESMRWLSYPPPRCRT
jgi:hypothetical protein